MSMLSMAGYALGVEMFRIAYQQAGMLGFACLSLAFSWPMCKWRAHRALGDAGARAAGGNKQAELAGQGS